MQGKQDRLFGCLRELLAQLGRLVAVVVLFQLIVSVSVTIAISVAVSAALEMRTV